MARKSRKERLFGAAVLKLSFQLRGQWALATFQDIYHGVLADLDLDDQDVDAYLNAHRPEVMGRVQASLPRTAPAASPEEEDTVDPDPEGEDR